MKWRNRLTAAFLCLILILCVIPVPALAAGRSRAKETEDPTVPTQPVEPADPAVDGLTPEGNLTLVDDTIDKSTGKEFLTVVTKNGNYFYIIIDRDDNEKSTVHFLNLVDERDLLELLSEVEIQDYQEQQAAKPTVPTVPEEAHPVQPEPNTPTEPSEPISRFDPQMDRETMILLCMPILVLIVGGFAACFIFRRKKPKSAPVAQENDDDWDYDYDPPEEDDDVSQEV